MGQQQATVCTSSFGYTAEKLPKSRIKIIFKTDRHTLSILINPCDKKSYSKCFDAASRKIKLTDEQMTLRICNTTSQITTAQIAA
jgi:hypothetical protein